MSEEMNVTVGKGKVDEIWTVNDVLEDLTTSIPEGNCVGIFDKETKAVETNMELEPLSNFITKEAAENLSKDDMTIAHGIYMGSDDMNVGHHGEKLQLRTNVCVELDMGIISTYFGDMEAHEGVEAFLNVLERCFAGGLTFKF